MRFASIFQVEKKSENFEDTLKILAKAKSTTDNFFDNVIVNDENIDIKKKPFRIIADVL